MPRHSRKSGSKLSPVFSRLFSSRPHPFFWSIILLVLVTTIFFHKVLFGHQVFFFGDTLLQRVPSMVFWKQQILSGHLPLWNPYIFAGVPHFADLSTNTLSPFNLIYLLIPNPFTALSILAFLEILLTSILMHVYLRTHINNISALFGAIVWSFSGTTLAAINDINSLQGIILIPAILIATHQLCTHPRIISIINLSLLMFLQFISGHPQYSYYTWIFVGCYLITFLHLQFKYKIRIITLVFTLFFGLSAIQLLPFIELSHLTYRPQELQFSDQNSLSIIDLPRFIFANIYGSWNTGTSWGPNSPLETGRANTEGYIGLITLVLALISVLKVKNSQTRFFIAVTFFSLILSFGSKTFLFTLLRQLLPLFNKFRSPIRILAFYSLGLSYLSAFGLNYLTSKHDRS